MTVLRIQGYALPEGEPIDLYADGDRWTTDPVPDSELVATGWILPGLVDAHTHPGAEEPGKPLDEVILRDDLRAHLAAGVTMIRSPGPGRRGRRSRRDDPGRYRLPPARPGRQRDTRAGRGGPEPAPGARRGLLGRPRLPGPGPGRRPVSRVQG